MRMAAFRKACARKGWRGPLLVVLAGLSYACDACGSFAGTPSGDVDGSAGDAALVDATSDANPSNADGATPATDGSSSANDGATPTDGRVTNGETYFEQTVYPSIASSCAATCHVAGNAMGAPVLFGSDAASTYAIFKSLGYDQPNNKFLTKGAHAGPKLSAAQVTFLQTWIGLEGGDGG
jgi:hypothetical protein